MNFGGFLDIIGAGVGVGGGNGRFANKSTPALSLALQTNMEGQIDQAPRISDMFESNVCGNKRRSREEDHDSRSVSDNLEDDVSGDDQDGSDNNNKSMSNKKKKKKKRYHRHTPQQIQELENLFKECPHPDEKQRLELSRRLNLETRQVKFWFQNRRTQMKTQIERHQNSILRQDNDRLQAENMSIREAMRSPICGNCGGSAMIGDLSFEEQHLRIENARLKEELERVCGLAGKFIRRPDLINSSFNEVVVPSMLQQIPLHLGPGTGIGIGAEFGMGVSNSFSAVSDPQPNTIERTIYLEIALAAMDELVKMGRTDEPLWVRDLEGCREVLNHDEYLRMFTPSQCIHGLKPDGFVTEASKVTDLVMINSLALVEILMDSNRWAEMFPCMIAKAYTRDIISSGMCGTRNGAIVLIQAEFQVVSPLVGVREVSFLRFCKQLSEGAWAVVDVSVDTTTTTAGGGGCRRLPSGCIVQDMPNGYSKVTWVEHSEYDESNIHGLYKPIIRAGMGFGAQPWLATLRRQCQCLAILMTTTTTTSSSDQTGEMINNNNNGKRSMLKLAQRMTHSFCAAVCESATSSYKWNKLSNVGEDVRVMTRKSVDDPGEPPGVVLSAATSVWLPISTQRLFEFLREARFRSEWDILSNGAPMEEIANISKAQDHGRNCVSLLRANAVNANQSSSSSSSSSTMLILQETSTDAAGSLVVYAPVDVPAMQVVMNGGDSAYVALLPSGFAIMPDGAHYDDNNNNNNNEKSRGGGALLTVAFQILVNSLPTAKLTVESVETVNHLISCTIDRIKSALSL